MKHRSSDTYFYTAAHIISFLVVIVSLGISIFRYIHNESASFIGGEKYEVIAFMLMFYATLVSIQIMIIKYTGKKRALSFLIPALLLTAFSVDLILFPKDRTYFWVLLVALYGVGALYTGFFNFLNFIFYSQILVLVLFLTRDTGGVKFTAVDAAFWIVSGLSAFFMLFLTRLLMLRSRTANHGQSLSETLLTTTPNAIVLVDSMMCIISMSNAFRKLFYIGDPGIAEGRPLVDLLPGDAKFLVSEITKSGLYYESIKELTIYNETGYYRIICDKLHGNVLGLFINIVDITPIMRAKVEVERAAKAKDMFLAKMSHEIRTPLNAITGMSELILREDANSRVREYAAGVKNAGINLISIINDILDFSKIESGTMEIVESNYEVESLLFDVINIIRMRVLDKPVLFIVNIDGGIPRALAGDVVRIRQILINVLNNAVKYTDAGFIELNFKSARRSENDIVLAISVSDSGRGIKQEDFGRVFGEFVQLDLKSNRGIEGTGLGLAITKNLCTAMGGEISLQSVYGEGSVFKIILPQRVSDTRELASVEDPENKTVLVYEGREHYARSISYSLTNLNVPHEIVSSFSAFNDALGSDGSYVTRDNTDSEPSCKWDYIFVVSIFYESVYELLKKRNIKSVLVMLSETNTTVIRDAVTIPMPAHTIAIARVLNNQGNDVVDHSVASEVKWVAPSVKILIVDDINTNLIVATGLMAPYKMQITGALSGQEAINLIKNNRYDLIFMDHMMPEMDGIETASVLRDMPNARDVPVIALTANAIHGVEEMFKQNGFSDLLVKPIEIQKLNAMLDKWVPQAKRRDYDPYLSKAVHFVAQTAALADAADSYVYPDVLTKVAEVTNNVFPDGENMAIEGVNCKDGIKNSGGSAEFYIKILRVFLEEGGEYVIKLNSCLKTADINLWTTYIHGLKSASANIGAYDISGLAAKLENSGKKGDWSYIDKNAGEFLRSFSHLLKKIDEYFSKNTDAGAYPAFPGRATAEDEFHSGLPDYSFLKERLAVLRTAAASFDIKTMEEVPETLLKHIWNKKISDMIQKIQSSVLLGDYAKTSGLTAELEGIIDDT